MAWEENTSSGTLVEHYSTLVGKMKFTHTLHFYIPTTSPSLEHIDIWGAVQWGPSPQRRTWQQCPEDRCHRESHTPGRTCNREKAVTVTSHTLTLHTFTPTPHPLHSRWGQKRLTCTKNNWHTTPPHYTSDLLVPRTIGTPHPTPHPHTTPPTFYKDNWHHTPTLHPHTTPPHYTSNLLVPRTIGTCDAIFANHLQFKRKCLLPLQPARRGASTYKYAEIYRQYTGWMHGRV